jgi:hypothetical protein
LTLKIEVETLLPLKNIPYLKYVSTIFETDYIFLTALELTFWALAATIFAKPPKLIDTNR